MRLEATQLQLTTCRQAFQKGEIEQCVARSTIALAHANALAQSTAAW